MCYITDKNDGKLQSKLFIDMAPKIQICLSVGKRTREAATAGGCGGSGCSSGNSEVILKMK